MLRSEVNIPTSSDVGEVRSSAQANGRRSLAFFLISIFGARIPEEQAVALQQIPLFQLRLLAEGLLLWTRIRGCAKPVPRNEAVAWLYPELFRPTITILPPSVDLPALPPAVEDKVA